MAKEQLFISNFSEFEPLPIPLISITNTTIYCFSRQKSKRNVWLFIILIIK